MGTSRMCVCVCVRVRVCLHYGDQENCGECVCACVRKYNVNTCRMCVSSMTLSRPSSQRTLISSFPLAPPPALPSSHSLRLPSSGQWARPPAPPPAGSASMETEGRGNVMQTQGLQHFTQEEITGKRCKVT